MCGGGGHLLSGMEEEPGYLNGVTFQSLKLYCYSIPLDTLGYHCMDSLNFLKIWPYVDEVLALLRFTSPWESYVVY